MCNNLAYIGRENHRAALNTIKLGAILGRARGKQGTGILLTQPELKEYYLSKSDKYLNHDSEDFVLEYNTITGGITPVDTLKISMVHNRQSSSGGVSAANVHPHEYGEKGNRTWFQHNGTIYNTDEICKHYNLDYKDFGNDSKLIGHLVHEQVDLTELFSMYDGYGVFIWYHEGQGNLNIFKGSHTRLSWDKEKKKNVDVLYEDRPLYHINTGSGYIFASLESTLDVLGDLSYEVERLAVNTVFHIYEDRIENHLSVPRNKKEYRKQAKTESFPNYGSGYNNTYNNSSSKFSTTHPNRVFIDKHQATFYYGRYYFNTLLMHGAFKLDKQGFPDFTPKATTYYFFNGRLVKDKAAFDELAKGKMLRPDMIHSESIHWQSKQYNKELKNYYKDGNMIVHTCAITPKFSPYELCFKYGELKETNLLTRESKSALEIYGEADQENVLNMYECVFNAEFDNVFDALNDFQDRMKVTGNTQFITTLFAQIVSGYNPMNDILLIEDYNDGKGTSFNTWYECLADFNSSEKESNYFGITWLGQQMKLMGILTSQTINNNKLIY
jgi:predicted glutamine amidotransferase